jgi:hypothetical protein
MLSNEDQAVKSCRRGRSPGGCVETSMAGRERKCPPSLPNFTRHRNLATAVEGRKDRSAEKARQGQLHPGEGVETYLAVVDA